jgi:hypothetical protein
MAYTKIATISKTYERIQENNIGISKHLLRQLCASGQIPVIKAGKTNLINWNCLMSFLDGEPAQAPQPETNRQIKPIPERLPIAR